jgi:UDP-N-acetylmuramoyl-tripeptide--D-alanyl-D-alanine ligase
MEIAELYNIWLAHPNISTDTRRILSGCIFFALKGDNFDGNNFASKALQLGANYVVIDNADLVIGSDPRYLLVNNVLETLQLLANHHRRQLKIPVLAITGSNGKTTTKELAKCVLSKKFKVNATIGNLNNHIGVPLTILSTTKDVEFLIVEMGANHQGEINNLCHIAQPDFVMITNIGKAHLDGFGGIEGIRQGKSEMFRYASQNNKKIFVNVEDEVLLDLLPKNSTTIPYNPTVLLEILQIVPVLKVKYRNEIITTHLFGVYNVANMAFAACLGEYFDVSSAAIVDALSEYVPDNNRSQRQFYGTNTLIKDAYNANPSSMALSLQSFSLLDGDKIVVLGDMLELGEFADAEHIKIIDLAASKGFEEMIFVGKNFGNVKQGMPGQYFENIEDARAYFQTRNYQNKLILLKGSRGISVEKIIQD